MIKNSMVDTPATSYATAAEVRAFIPAITSDGVATALIANATDLIDIDLG